ncbi:glycosyltransferase family 4 protein, partial [Ardenticatena maritima]
PFDTLHPHLAKVWFEQVGAPRAAQAVQADVYHVPYFAPPLQAPLPVVATVHDLIPLLLPAYRGNWLVRLYTALVAHAARRTPRLLADSEATRRDILTHLRVPAERVQTVYLATDIQPPTPDAVAAVRTRYALPESYALYLGGFDVRKRVPLLIRALARTSGDWTLVIAGRLPQSDTDFTPDPRRVAETLGVAHRLHFCGFVPDEEKPALIGGARLFVFPSVYEGFGLPVLEALACGVPVITTTASSLPEVAGNAGVLVPPDDETSLAQALDRLMQDDALHAQLAAEAVRQAARFSWNATARATAHVYETLTTQQASTN